MVLGYGGLCAYMWETQRDHVFEPELLMQTTPDRLGIKFQEFRIPDGIGPDQGELAAWWIPADNPSAPTLLYLHGNYRNMADNLDHVLRLHNFGLNVFLVDYRGYGKSTGGRPSEVKVYEDAEAAWQYMSRMHGVSLRKAFIYGHSLGGAIAIELAVHHPEAAGLIVESTFTSMADMADLAYPLLPVDLLLNQRFESLKKISQLRVPVLIVHGTWDKRVPVMMAQELYEAAPPPKQLVLIEGGEHNNSGAVGLAEYRATLSSFVRRYSR
jgi:fermentation-respiration switch protein FrsA (DUF1100 family)